MKDRTAVSPGLCTKQVARVVSPDPVAPAGDRAGQASGQATGCKQAARISIAPQAPLREAQSPRQPLSLCLQHGPAHQTCSMPVAPLRPAAETPGRADLPGLSTCYYVPATLIQPVWQVTARQTTARAKHCPSRGCTHVSVNAKAQATAS